MRLDGRIAVVTGASRGLGFRLSEALIAEGARVAMIARGEQALRAAAAPFGTMALPIAADLTLPCDVAGAFSTIKEHFGNIDILINNAATGSPYKIEALDAAVVQAELATNLLAPMLAAQQVIPMMRARGRGDIVNISSESAGRPFPYLTVYAAAKAGLEAFSRGLREEVRDTGIRVCCLRSGRMQESGFSAGWTPEIRTDYVRLATLSGSYHHAGLAIPPAHTAQAIVDILCLPDAAHVDFIELRSNLPWRPE